MSEDSPKIPFPQPHFDRLLESRILWVGSDVNDTMAADLCAKMLLLSAEDPKADIYMYLNSPGGSVTAGLSIYDIMELIPNDVVTIATGMAALKAQEYLDYSSFSRQGLIDQLKYEGFSQAEAEYGVSQVGY